MDLCQKYSGMLAYHLRKIGFTKPSTCKFNNFVEPSKQIYKSRFCLSMTVHNTTFHYLL